MDIYTFMLGYFTGVGVSVICVLGAFFGSRRAKRR